MVKLERNLATNMQSRTNRVREEERSSLTGPTFSVLKRIYNGGARRKRLARKPFPVTGISKFRSRLLRSKSGILLNFCFIFMQI